MTNPQLIFALLLGAIAAALIVGCVLVYRFDQNMAAIDEILGASRQQTNEENNE